MGTLQSKTFYIDKTHVEWTIFYSAQGTDILSSTTRYILGTLITPDRDTLEQFRLAVRLHIADRPRELPYLAGVCAYAIKLRRKYHLSPWELVNIIDTELKLPWTITA